jgi:hypothetical protein
MKRVILKSVALSTILASVLALGGCGSSKSPVKNDTSEIAASCDISGQITNLGAVKGASVSIFDKNTKIGAATTDANGRFTFKSLQSNCDRGLISGGIDLGTEAGEQDDRTIDGSTAFAIPATQGQVNINIIGNELRVILSCDIANLDIDDKYYYVFAKEMMQNIGFDDAKAKEIAAKGLSCANLSTASVNKYNKQAIIDAALDEMAAKGITGSQKDINRNILDKVLEVYGIELSKGTQLARATVHTIADAVDYFAKHSVNGDTNSNNPQPAIFTADDLELIDKVVAPANITAIETSIAAKPDASRTRFGHKIASTFIYTKTLIDSGVNPGLGYSIPTPPDQSPKIDQNCMASAVPGVCRAPTDDRFMIAVDYADVNYIDENGDHHRGGALVYQATAENGLSIVRHLNNDDAKNDIERIDIYRKFIVLNDAAKALDSVAQYELIKDKIKNLFTLDAATFKLDTDRFTSPKRLLLTLVADFNDLKGQSVDQYHEYATVSFPVLVERNDESNTLKVTVEENAKAVFTAKANGQTPIILQATNDVVRNLSKEDGAVSYNFCEYYQKLIDKIDEKVDSATEQAILNKIKKMLVEHATNYTNVKIYVTMNELNAGDLTPKNNFVRNPGTFNPADFALTSESATNIYRNVFTSANTTNNGLMNSINFRVILENPVEN